jgi:hypothetical protein
MYRVIKDNKEILRYRGLLTPGDTILGTQQEAVRLALLQLSNLNTNALGRFSSGKDTDPNTVISSNPYMRLLPENGGISDTSVYDFYFPFTPQGISYTDMSDEIAEIPRPGTTPIVTFRSHRLMKVSMEFLVAVPYDGLILDIEDSLNILRFFSTNSQRSVIFYNLDNLLTAGHNYRKGPFGRPAAFTITEMNITARQRNSNGKITQAIVNMSFVENRNPNIVVTKVPPFRKKKKEKKKCGKKGQPPCATITTKPPKVPPITQTMKDLINEIFPKIP